MVEWLDNLLTFPVEYEFIKYLLLGVLVVISVSLAYGLITSMISSIFNRF